MKSILKKLCVILQQMLNPTIIQERSLEVTISTPEKDSSHSGVTYCVDGNLIPSKNLTEDDIASDISYVFMVESGHRIGDAPTERIYASVKARHDAKFKERVESNGVTTVWTIWISYENVSGF